jgi:hypothetical protein
MVALEPVDVGGGGQGEKGPGWMVGCGSRRDVGRGGRTRDGGCGRAHAAVGRTGVRRDAREPDSRVCRRVAPAQGQMLAALLGWPQATFACKVEAAPPAATGAGGGGGPLRVTREVDGGLEVRLGVHLLRRAALLRRRRAFAHTAQQHFTCHVCSRSGCTGGAETARPRRKRRCAHRAVWPPQPRPRHGGKHERLHCLAQELCVV